MGINDTKNGLGTRPLATGATSCLPQLSVEPVNISYSIGKLQAVIGLSASPVFASMALICGIYQDELSAICASGPGALPLTGMVWMYVLMSIFHVGAWLRLLEGQQLRQK